MPGITASPHAQNVVPILIKSIKIPQILLDSRSESLASVSAFLKSNKSFMDSNISILFNSLRDDGVFAPIQVYREKGKTTSYVLTEGLLRLKIYEELKKSTNIPAIIVPYDADILHRAFIGNMAREDYSLPELAAWIIQLTGNGETENSLFTRFHIPRTRIVHALFSVTPEYIKLLSKYPETAITTLHRIHTATDADSIYMVNPITRKVLLDTLQSLEGHSVPKSIIDTLLYDANQVIINTVLLEDGKTTYERADKSSVSTTSNDDKAPLELPVFYREATVTMDTFISSVAKIEEAIKKYNIAQDDIKVTIQITKQATAKLVHKEEQSVSNYDIEKWLNEK